jgi:hypothetical protein
MIDHKPIAESNNFIILDKYTRDGVVAEINHSNENLFPVKAINRGSQPSGIRFNRQRDGPPFESDRTDLI